MNALSPPPERPPPGAESPVRIQQSRSAGQQVALIVVGVVGGRQPCRSTIIFLISAMDLAGLRPLGQVLVQFMMV